MISDHPQYIEALERLLDELSLAIVDPDESKVREVRAQGNENFKFVVEASSRDEPTSVFRAQAVARGFKIERIDGHYRFGPMMGQPFTCFRTHRDDLAADTAASEAIELFLILTGWPRDKWLWITLENYADRGRPEPPSV